jgi:hypothetical protein
LNKAQKETVKSFASVTETTCVRNATRAAASVRITPLRTDVP